MTDAPTTPPGAAEARIREELEKAASLISAARRLMGEGRNVDLGALGEHMRAVTLAVQGAPKDIAQGFTEHLEALMAALDALESDLETQHRALEDGLDAIRRREAQGAYQGPTGGAPAPSPAPSSASPTDSGEDGD